jgi:2,4-dienoyl-CoA reductase-like NADH-dependent reductase (Old Yellow Enzyme family)
MSHPMLFSPLSIRDVRLKNRVVVSPMHQYSGVNGFATDWHLMNVGRYAAGGAGLVFMESTKVERRGCGTVGDLGLWDDAFIAGLRRCVDFIRAHNAVPGIQLGHSGRKARRFRPWEGGAPLEPSPEIGDWEAWDLVSSSALNAPESEPVPRALTQVEIGEVVTPARVAPT